jgi:hypothetical protein
MSYPAARFCLALAEVLPLYCLTPDVAPCGAGTGRYGGHTRADSANRGGKHETIPGHYSTSDVFGFSAPGVAAQIQVAFRPAK